MTEETSSEQDRAALLPVDTLKKLCLEEYGDYTWSESRLQRETESLKAVIDPFLSENNNDEQDETCILWVTKGSFVRAGFSSAQLPAIYREWFCLWLESSDSCHLRGHRLFIHSATLEEAINCLDVLVGLHDSYFQKMEIAHNVPGDDGQPPICPLTDRVLEKLVLQNSKRQNKFYYMVFTAKQSRILAVAGRRTHVGFWRCRFEDDGSALMEASESRKDQELGPAMLTISRGLPFREGNLGFFIKKLKLHSLKLDRVLLNSESSRALSVAEINYLDLDESRLSVGGGAALVDSVKEGRGPKGLCFRRDLFDSREGFLSFLKALRGNAYLERMDLSWINSRDVYHLAAALRENKGLTHLSLRYCNLGDRCWTDLLVAISRHPALRTLDFSSIDGERRPASSFTSRDRTKSVANMLLVNTQVDEMVSDDDSMSGYCTFDRDDWEALVAPKLEFNLFRKRFGALQKIEVPSTRAAIFARALARVETKPSVAWMALSFSQDIICSYQNEA
jgi:hypothetical protein